MKDIVILGRPLHLQERSKAQMKGITIGDSLAYKFYDGEYLGVPLLFAEPKGKAATPRSLSVTAGNLTSLLQRPTVFLLPECPAYERQRLIDKNVYFVVSSKYAHLPMLVANERMRRSRQQNTLMPVAQYLLLYHLQIESLEGRAARDIEDKIPFSYAGITLGVTCLENLGLCRKETDGSKRKSMRFDKKGEELWKQAQPFLISPVSQRIYCDDFISEERFATCGINALAHYTRLNADPEKMIAMNIKQLRKFIASGALVNHNEYDGNVVIEAWKYPAVADIRVKAEWVDKLSLAISLRNDTDPRVEGELEHLINNIEWKD